MPEGMMVHLYLDAGEPDAATSCKSGSEGGGWKSAHWVTRRPPTLLDAIFFLDLPCEQQRSAIWNLYLGVFGLDQDQKKPADENWSGAEIRACCRLAALLDVPVVEAATNIVPIAVTAAESIDRLRSWANGRCLSAELPGIYRCLAKQSKGGRKINRDPSVN